MSDRRHSRQSHAKSESETQSSLTRLTDRSIGFGRLVVGADRYEAEVKPSTTAKIFAGGKCSPTTSTGGELTVKPFSIGGKSGTASTIQALATSVPKRNAAQGLLKSHAWYFTFLFFLDVAFERTVPHSAASDEQSIAHAHRSFLQILAFPFPSIGRQSGPEGLVASATVPDPSNQIRRWLKHPRGVPVRQLRTRTPVLP
jgi:hypothetical protein